MAKNSTNFSLKQIKPERTEFVDTDGTNSKVIATGQAEDSWVYNIEICNYDSIVHNFNLIHTDSNGNDDIIYVGQISANAGKAINNPPITLIQNKAITGLLSDPSGNLMRPVANGEFLKLQLGEAVQTGVGKKIIVRVTRGDF